jgi:membrane-bound ClpP family serine protease
MVFTGAELICAVCIAAGWIGILLEFVRPGWVVPGVAGAVMLLFGLSRMLPEHATLALMVSAPFLATAAWMLAVGRRARRNKRAL